MKKKSKFTKCQEIYMEEVTTTAKLPSVERARIVLRFVNEVGCKEGTANVYFSHILNGNRPSSSIRAIQPNDIEVKSKQTPDVDVDSNAEVARQLQQEDEQTTGKVHNGHTSEDINEAKRISEEVLS